MLQGARAASRFWLFAGRANMSAVRWAREYAGRSLGARICRPFAGRANMSAVRWARVRCAGLGDAHCFRTLESRGCTLCKISENPRLPAASSRAAGPAWEHACCFCIFCFCTLHCSVLRFIFVSYFRVESAPLTNIRYCTCSITLYNVHVLLHYILYYIIIYI